MNEPRRQEAPRSALRYGVALAVVTLAAAGGALYWWKQIDVSEGSAARSIEMTVAPVTPFGAMGDTALASSLPAVAEAGARTARVTPMSSAPVISAVPVNGVSPSGPPNSVDAGSAVRSGVGLDSPAGATIVVREGTQLMAFLSRRTCSDLLGVGDVFTVRTNDDVRSGSIASIPNGSAAVLRVTAIEADLVPVGGITAEAFKLVVGQRDYEIGSRPIHLAFVELDAPTARAAAKKVGIGAAVGAALGALVSKGKAGGVVTGAAVGAAVGGVKAATANGTRCLEAGLPMTIQLTAAITLKDGQ